MLAVAATGFLQPDQGVRAAFRRFDFQLEMAMVDMRRGDAFQPFQRLDAALRLLGLAGLGAEAADEILEVGDLFLLLRKGLVLLHGALGTGAFEAVVVCRYRLSIIWSCTWAMRLTQALRNSRSCDTSSMLPG